MLTAVPREHFEYLLEGVIVSDDAREELDQHLDVFTEESLAQFVQILEDAYPGLGEHLVSTWEPTGGYAVYMWRVFDFVQADPDGIQELLGVADMPLDAWSATVGTLAPDTPIVDQPTPEPRIVKRKRTADAVVVRVRVYQKMSVSLEDSSFGVLKDRDVDVWIMLDGTGRVDVRSSYQPMRKAFICVMKTYFDERITARNRLLAKYAEPVKFTEGNARAFATEWGGVWHQVDGPDALGVVGEVTYKGKKSGRNREALPLNARSVKAQDNQLNDGRQYTINYSHSFDDFDEAVELYFKFGSNPHVGFGKRTSRSASKDLLASFFERVR